MDDAEGLLYKFIGERLRALRERQSPKVSQAKLAAQLGVSRASVVNIEGGRQHAPLYFLWRIAAALDADLDAIIPRRAELTPRSEAIELSPEMQKEIKQHARGNPELERSLASFVGKVLNTLPPTNEAEKK